MTIGGVAGTEKRICTILTRGGRAHPVRSALDDGLHLPLDYAAFDGSSLSRFHTRLVEGGRERYAFDRFVAVGRAAAFIPDKVTLLHDTAWTKGAGAVQDTYTLLRKGIRSFSDNWDSRLDGQSEPDSAARSGLTASRQLYRRLVSRFLHCQGATQGP